MVKFDDTIEGIDGANTYLMTYGKIKPKALMKMSIDDMPCLMFGTLVMILYKPPQPVYGMKMDDTSSIVFTNDTFYFNNPFVYYHMRKLDVTGKRYDKIQENDIASDMSFVNQVLNEVKTKRDVEQVSDSDSSSSEDL